MPKNPRVSVIIASYNQGQTICEAIDSVLNQTFKDFEIIVIDRSTDNTREVLSSYKNKIRYVRQKSQGVSAARNLGIKCAKGEYIAILDSDDMWLPHRLEEQVAVLDNSEDVGFVYSNYFSFDDGRETIKGAKNTRRFLSGHILKEVMLRKAMCFFASTWLVRKNCFEVVGYFDTSLKMAETREMTVRIAIRYKMYGIKEPLALIRQHTPGASLSRLPAKEKEYYTSKFLDSLFHKNDDQVINKNRRRMISVYHLLNGKNYLREGNVAVARNRFWKCILNHPFQREAYIYLAGSLLGIKGFSFARGVKKSAKSLLDKVLYLPRTVIGAGRRPLHVIDVLKM